MKLKTQSTPMITSRDINRKWHLYDLKGKTLGRAATDIARLLIGKHKPSYTPHLDNGDFVVAINAAHIHVTGKKMSDKIYFHHSGYPGGLHQKTLQEILAKNPARVIELAVAGMLPKNKLRKPRLRRLKVYPYNTHPHTNHFPKTTKQSSKEK